MIKNLTTNKIVSKHEIQAKSFCSQALGLMFKSKNNKQNLIMHFKTKRTISLHNFFVFYPLEIIVLDKNKQVLEINKEFKPFTLFKAKNKGQFCIELGITESKNKVKVGDILKF